jgi:hypothetical protein
MVATIGCPFLLRPVVGWQFPMNLATLRWADAVPSAQHILPLHEPTKAANTCALHIHRPPS